MRSTISINAGFLQNLSSYLGSISREPALIFVIMSNNIGEFGYFANEDLAKIAKEMSDEIDLEYKDCCYLVLINKLCELVDFITPDATQE